MKTSSTSSSSVPQNWNSNPRRPGVCRLLLKAFRHTRCGTVPGSVKVWWPTWGDRQRKYSGVCTCNISRSYQVSMVARLAQITKCSSSAVRVSSCEDNTVWARIPGSVSGLSQTLRSLKVYDERFLGKARVSWSLFFATRKKIVIQSSSVV